MIRGLPTLGKGTDPSIRCPSTESCRGAVMDGPGDTEDLSTNSGEVVSDRTGASGGGVKCVPLALKEEGAVDVNPILEEGWTVCLHKGIYLRIVRCSSRNKEDLVGR